MATNQPKENPQSRSSSRERQLTEKGKEMQEQVVKKSEKAFNKAYDLWKQLAKEIRTGLKSYCSPEELVQSKNEIQAKRSNVHQYYEPIVRNHASTPTIVKKMDACAGLTGDICEIINKRLETIEDDFNDQLEKERVRMTLSKEEHGSIFGNSKTETVISECQDLDNESHVTPKISPKQADAEADLAAKLEQAQAMERIQVQQAKVHKLERDWQLKQSQMLAEIQLQEADAKLRLENERLRLHQIQSENEVKIAAARVKVYDNLDYGEKEDLDLKMPFFQQKEIVLNARAAAFQPHNATREVQPTQDMTNLAQAITSSLSLNRLPVPEPTVFTGDPLKYVDWKLSFVALIDQKPLPVGEKMFYLKNYLAGEAQKAVRGFFYRNTEDAYQGVWAVLQDRYGSPFVIQRAYREKLGKWPKIPANDPIALREFADFLLGCAEAIPHVTGLDILNDCEENSKLLKKLPEWMVHKWSRIVVDELDNHASYPSFALFTEFMQKEARIACNPITAPLLMKTKFTDERVSKRAKVFSTNVQIENANHRFAKPSSSEFKPACLFCKDEMHGVVKCPTFAAKSTDEKKIFIQENHLCFGCLRKGHNSKDCKRRHTCDVCGRRHPTCLHREKGESMTPLHSSSMSSGDGENIHTAITHVMTRQSSATSSIVPVFVSSATEPQREILTYALLDTQSDSTFILEDIINELSINAQPVQLQLSTMTSVKTVVRCKTVRDLQIRGFNNKMTVCLQQAYTQEFIPVDRSHIPTKKTALQWAHLKHLAGQLPPLQDCQIGLLIGFNCPSALAPLEVVTGANDEPFAQRTALGWSIIGLTNPHLDRKCHHSLVHRISVKEVPLPVPTDVLKVLESDFSERHYEEKYVSQEDVQFLQILSGNIIQRKDGHYELPLPFKGCRPPLLPNNKRLAMIRLQHLKRKLQVNAQYYEHYTSFMEKMISRGDAERAPFSSEKETLWYIPHHGVYHPRKPGKLRVVFDCSAKFQSVSLNNNLLTGPDLINSLVGVLCRFRKETVAIVCDIERMFHQFFVSPGHRNYLRFFWWEGGQLQTEPKEYRMAVHLFGAASSPGCANFCLRYLAQQHKDDFPVASNFIENNFYVDDGLVSVSSSEAAKQLITEAQRLCKIAGLRLHKFDSNRPEVLSCVAPSERATISEPLSIKPDRTHEGYVLGIQWLMKTDVFGFNIEVKETPPTRRTVLSVVASLFDPLGFLAPFILTGKHILQELCQKGKGWDDPLPDNLLLRWEEWKSGLQLLKEVYIPRCYYPPDFGNIVQVELHHFSDASNVGYGACSYLRYKNDENKVHCSLVIAKARVAPIKVHSIPRLELSAAVTSAKLSLMLKTELQMKIDGEYFWTDSQVVLAYISNEARRFHVFVANRVQLIRTITDPNQWHYVDTSQNSADHASRGLSARDLPSTNWLSGPKFLWEEEVLPASNPSTELLIGDPEVKTVQVLATHVCKKADMMSRLSRFSSWTKLVKVVARIKRLGIQMKPQNELVTVEERRIAANVLIELAQEEFFFQEINLLKKGNTVPKSSPLYCLDPIVTDGLLRVGGRLKASHFQELKHPVILPRDSYFTQLILSHYHNQICHQGRNQTLMEIRANGFWIIGGSKLVAKFVHKCVKCRKLRRPSEEQRMAELPKERVEVSAPFTNCGMDCFGPFITKQGRKECKRYGLIFTCLTSRAVHIEMLVDLTTDAFINALRCFISLRGAVSQLHCDQGTNFVGGKNEFREALKQCDVKTLEEFLANNQCEFVFNAPSASHAGGIWERQIRTIRNVLKVTVPECKGRLDDASLRTLFYEAMAIVNSRPLAVDGINDPHALEPLTPNHLILMKSKVALSPPGTFVKEDMYAVKRWRRVQYLTEQFWSRWKKEYLWNVATRQKWHVPRRNVKVDDIVIIREDMLPRSQWQLGRVIDTTASADGLVRRVKIQVGERRPTKSNCLLKPSIIERPIQKLVLLIEGE